MDLLGARRRRRDLMALEQGRHRLLATEGPLACSCRWIGPDLTGQPIDRIEKAFARHLATARRDRLREPLAA